MIYSKCSSSPIREGSLDRSQGLRRKGYAAQYIAVEIQICEWMTI